MPITPKQAGTTLLRAISALALCTTIGFAEDSKPSLIRNEGFEAQDNAIPTDWKTWTPRDELAPEFGTDQSIRRSGTTSARIRCNRLEQLGLLRQKCTAVVGGSPYRFTGYFRTDHVETVQESIWAKLEWRNAADDAIAKDYAIHFKEQKDGWFRIEDEFLAPEDAVAVEVEIGLQWCQGTVWWDDLNLQPCSRPPVRTIRVSTGFVMPKSPTDVQKNLAFFVDKVDQAGRENSDIVCLGETVNYVRTGRLPYEVAEPIPGPFTTTLGETARRNKIWIVVGLYERDDKTIYNTAVLLNREGKVAGRYRKTHLPETEVIAGVTPGTEYPVFKTDFGTIGMQICWDNFFPEVARSLALNGAEIIFTPIWGDGRENGTNWDVVARSRAIDNSVYFVAATYSSHNHSLIVDPGGRVCADTKGNEGLVTADLDLSLHKRERWLSVSSSGDWKHLLVRERRPTTYARLGKMSGSEPAVELMRALSTGQATNANENER